MRLNIESPAIWALQTCSRSKVPCIFLSFQLLSLSTCAAAPLEASQALNPISTPALDSQCGTACVRSSIRKQLTGWNLRLVPSLPSWPWRLNLIGEHLCGSIDHLLELPLAGNGEEGINTRGIHLFWNLETNVEQILKDYDKQLVINDAPRGLFIYIC